MTAVTGAAAGPPRTLGDVTATTRPANGTGPTGTPAPQQGRALDAIFAVMLGSCLLGVAGLAPQVGGALSALLIGLSLLTALPWAVLRRPDRSPAAAAAAALLLAALGLALPAAGLNLFGMAVAWFTALVLALRFGTRWAVCYALLAALVVGALHALSGGEPAAALLEALAVVVPPAMALATGRAVLSAEHEREHMALLVRQRDQALQELRRAHQALERSAAGSQQLVLARERERAARDLHDGLGHRLAVCAMSLEFAERTRETDPEGAWREIAHAREGVRETSLWLRRWVRALHPLPEVETVGVQALERIAEIFRGTGLEVRVDIRGDARPPEGEVSLLISRIVQEGLTNTLRAGAARSVAVLVRLDERSLHLSLEDDGGRPEPTDPPAPEGSDGLRPAPEGFGLRTLRERVEALGGSLRAGWRPKGFVLSATVPYDTADGPDGREA